MVQRVGETFGVALDLRSVAAKEGELGNARNVDARSPVNTATPVGVNVNTNVVAEELVEGRPGEPEERRVPQ